MRRPLSSRSFRPPSSLQSRLVSLETLRDESLRSSDFPAAQQVEIEMSNIKQDHLQNMKAQEEMRQAVERECLNKAQTQSLEDFEQNYEKKFHQHEFEAYRLRHSLNSSQSLRRSKLLSDMKSTVPVSTASHLERELAASEQQLIKLKRFDEAAQARRSSLSVAKAHQKHVVLQQRIERERILADFNKELELESSRLEERITKDRLALQRQYEKDKHLLTQRFRNSQFALNHAHRLEFLSKPAPCVSRFTPKATDRGSRLYETEKKLVKRSVPIPSKCNLKPLS
ncbi:hypothetical protein GEMRC1_000266 [Eukaryota sp. GEM-RC1]